ncbi:MAG TPA: ATPase, T2SS/T4P/T4SS family [Gaiellaceae bacterium]|nr:ATPase, T2SS/T4P/T4SS family [Gaiellaceae bacterium]
METAMSAAELPTPLPLEIERAEPRAQLGALLVRDGLLTPEQLEDALVEKERSGGRLGEIVVERGWVSGAAVARALAEQHQLEYLDLGRTNVDPAAAGLLPERFARRYDALPVKFLAEDTVLVAVGDPTNVLASDDLRLALGLNVRLAVVPAPDLRDVIARTHRAHIEVDEEAQGLDEEETNVEDIRDGAATSAPAIRLVNQLIARAIDERASDVHFEPQAKHMVVRARVDGVMRRLTTIPRAMQPAVVSRLKIMGELDIAERRAPQDGRLSIRFGGHPMDIRIAVLPTTYGEQVVLRILNRGSERLTLDDLGMSPTAAEAFSRSIRQPYGAVIACGPTGSGKTTTLYAALDVLNDAERVLMTIEDPVEYQTAGITQIEVNPKSGLTFARGLRTILRSDPDVLLVGEIRDEETARIAIQAAMTGHLVLTTLHTHNAASSIARLKDMGVEPELLASSVNCIVAQRLARRLCLECREPYWPSAAELVELGVGADANAAGSGDVWLYRARGCVQCAGTGYSGRVALYEVMEVRGRIRRLIEASTEEIFAAAVEQGMQTLRQDGIRLCLAGVSSLDEVRRVTGDRLS